MTRILGIVAALVIVAGGAFWFVTQNSGGSPAVPTAANGEAIDTSMVAEMTLGNPDASVTVIEYASYSCPFCGRFHEGPFKDLKADYIDTGKIQFVYREVFFEGDLPALWAGMVARCAGPERFFGVVDEIYRNQPVWSRANSAADAAAALRRIGLTAGLAQDDLEACLADGDMARAMAAVDEMNRAEHGVNSTPTFVINGTTYSNMEYDEFTRLIDAELGT
ncbi:MAG: DsbA family protein [Pseudomonadota bacterium]